MSLRVAFDLDGTIADMASALGRESKRLFGNEIAMRPDATTTPEGAPENGPDGQEVMREIELTPRQRNKLWAHVKTLDNFWNSLEETEDGIVRRIANAAAARRWEVIFLTTRPAVAGDTTQTQSQVWLQAHGFKLPSVFVVQRSRGKIADALHLDAVVDDRPENCLDVAVESKAKPILIWRGDPRDLPPGAKRLGVHIAPTISEAIDVLESLDDMRKESGVVRSIKKLFGRETLA
jgi:hypothetical protein